MTEIKDTVCLRIPFKVTEDAGTWVLTFDRAYTSYYEAKARVEALEALGWIAKYVKSPGQPHCVYKRKPNQGRRY